MLSTGHICWSNDDSHALFRKFRELTPFFLIKVAKKVDEQWDKIMDGVENQTRQGRKTPLASNTQSLNVKNKSKDSKQTTSTSHSTVSSKADSDKKAASDQRLNSELSSSSEKAINVSKHPAPRSARIHTAPIITSNNTDDTDNDITTDSDMAHTEDDKVVVSSSVLTGLLAQLASKQVDGRSRHAFPRPASARDRRQVSRERERTTSKDRPSKDRQRSRDRLRSRERPSARENADDRVAALALINQDRQEPDGRSSRQGRPEEKVVSSKSVRPAEPPPPPAKLESEGRCSGHSLDRGNNTGSSEPPTVIEVHLRSLPAVCHNRYSRCLFSFISIRPVSVCLYLLDTR